MSIWPVLAALAYALPIAWAILVVVRLREQRDLLQRISSDISALRKTSEDDRSVNG
ncbi:MAG: hypothetical protein WDA27_13665 [Actinomycetota bacterium]